MGFPLLDLNPTLLEKIINKLESKDYFRLQQTCRDMTEFIQNSKNISVYDDGYLSLVNDNQFSLYNGGSHIIDIASLYGTRILRLCLPEDVPWGFSAIYDALQNYQITCDTIYIGKGQWTTEEYARLLNILKHTKIVIKKYQEKPFEALFQAKSLENIQIAQIESEMAVEVAERLLPAFSQVKIEFVAERKEDHPQPFYSILQILCTKDFPNLHSFEYSGYLSTGDALSLKEEVGKILRNLDILELEWMDHFIPRPFELDDYYDSAREQILTIEIPNHSSRVCRVVCTLFDDGACDYYSRMNRIYCSYSVN